MYTARPSSLCALPAPGSPHLHTPVPASTPDTDLVSKGYEWTLLHGEPHNPGANTYMVPKPCCKMSVTKLKQFQCEAEWDPREELPYGNAFSGTDNFQVPGKDSGTYNGTTVKLVI